jgi:hypothetical protein
MQRGIKIFIAGFAAALGSLGMLTSASVAATIDVNLSGDLVANDSQCSLREAISATNTNANVNGADDCPHPGGTAADTIQLDPSTTYELAGTPGEDENLNASGDLDIDANVAGPSISGALTIDGAGAGSSVIDGNDVDRVVDVSGAEGNSTVTIEGTTLRDGRTPSGAAGGGIRASFAPAIDLTLNGAVVTSNQAAGPIDARGGGIFVQGGLGSDVVLTDTTVSDNRQDAAGAGAGRAGGVEVIGQVLLELTDSVVTGNVNEGADGGGIVVGAAASLEASGSQITDNHALASGPGDPRGGGIFWGATSGTQQFLMTDTEVSGNTAPGGNGGGIHRSFQEDTAILRLSGVTVADNSAAAAGGIQTSGVNEIVNSTISGNRSTEPTADGGGINLVDDIGGSTLELRLSTIADNSADTGDAIQQSQFAVLEAGNSILANDPSDGNTNDACGTSLGIVNDADRFFNVDDGTSCNFGNGDGNQSSTDAELGPLAFNGGPTRTHELTPGSPAVDVGPEDFCYTIDGPPDDVAFDQRGLPRPVNGFCDSGAYELNAVCLGRGVTVPTTTGNDNILGTEGPDVISGGLGGDEINGAGGNDLICGDGANDILTGGGGSDQLLGGAGMDALFARDGVGDVVNCDLDADTAQTDQLSLDSVSGCETLDALPEPPPSTGGPTETGQRAAALKKCKKKKTAKAKKKCRKKARKLPV